MDYKIEYDSFVWKTVGQLAIEMTLRAKNGEFVDTHIYTKDGGGESIFKKTSNELFFLDKSITLHEVYRILNSTDMVPYEKAIHIIDKAIKEHIEKRKV